MDICLQDSDSIDLLAKKMWNCNTMLTNYTPTVKYIQITQIRKVLLFGQRTDHHLIVTAKANMITGLSTTTKHGNKEEGWFLRKSFKHVANAIMLFLFSLQLLQAHLWWI